MLIRTLNCFCAGSQTWAAMPQSTLLLDIAQGSRVFHFPIQYHAQSIATDRKEQVATTS